MTDNFNVNDYIKEMDLSPELEEKARQCQNSSELMELAAENDVELPLDALEMVSGGCGKGCDHDWQEVVKYGQWNKVCTKCGKVMYDRSGSGGGR